MKIVITSIALLALIVSCTKSTENVQELNTTDIAAVTGMVGEVNFLRQASLQLSTASTPQQRHHADSSFHHHDSLHWVHHSHYNTTNNHPHNDHIHNWVPYNPTVNHTHHYHPHHPGHPNDSLVVILNGHHTAPAPHHPGVHTINDHHVMDSLHHVHQGHHP